MNVLIIGGSGFLSGTLARLALASNHRVWVVTRGQRPVPMGAHALVADRQDSVAFARAIEQAQTTWDLAVDCIAYKSADVRQDIDVLSSRARHLIYVSTDFVYDPLRRRLLQDEENAIYLADGYGGRKRAGEMELLAANTDMKWSVVRPCHIYGPGSKLGCLPEHGRDPQLIERMRAGESLRLVGGGYFLQQPVAASDLAQTILSMANRATTFGQTFNVAGPDLIEAREYYRIIADVLGVTLLIIEVPVDDYRREHPEAASHLCHRYCDVSKLRAAGGSMPSTPLDKGLREHVASILDASQ